LHDLQAPPRRSFPSEAIFCPSFRSAEPSRTQSSCGQISLADVLFAWGATDSVLEFGFSCSMTQDSWHRNLCSTPKQESASKFVRQDSGVRPGTRSTKCQALLNSAFSCGRAGVPSVCSHHADLTPAILAAQGPAPISRQTLNIFLRHMHIHHRRKQNRWLDRFWPSCSSRLDFTGLA
jgi:hypothetical protein